MNLYQRNTVGQNADEENVYEYYDKPLPNVPTTAKKRISGLFRKSRKASFVFHVLLLLMVIVGAIFSMMTYIKYESSSKVYKSCKELREAGFASSGIYNIQPVGDYPKYKVYCDMTSDGGGWTLVASIHEDDVQSSRCSSKDRWTFTSSNLVPMDLWSSPKTIGNLEEVTSDDYKSQAYVMPASDVLISHVPSDIAIEDVEKESYLKYQTYDHFLDEHGSSLQAFYSDYAPLKVLNILGVDEKVTTEIQEKGGLSDLFRDWYNYAYDTGTDSIRILDERNHMIDIGNKVYFSIGDEPYRLMSYGKSYTDSKTYHISSAATYPFVTMATITAGDSYLSKFRLKVELNVNVSTSDVSYVSEVYGKYHMYGQVLQTGTQNSFSNNGTTRPNICRLLFFIRQHVNPANFNFNFPRRRSRGTTLGFEATITENPQNAFVGYMLLSRSNGRSFTNSDIRSVLKKVAIYASQIDDLKLQAQASEFIFPVKYLKGQVNFTNTNVTSGFLQLRPYDEYGIPYAMCPGVRLSGNADPELYCIGTGERFARSCSDFSAWDQLPEHSQIRRTSYKNESFVSDIHSTILIFTR